MLSKPVALLTFKFDKKFLTKPTLVKGILNSALLGTLDCTVKEVKVFEFGIYDWFF